MSINIRDDFAALRKGIRIIEENEDWIEIASEIRDPEHEMVQKAKVRGNKLQNLENQSSDLARISKELLSNAEKLNSREQEQCCTIM